MSEQIVEKLKLLGCEGLFTKIKGHHPMTTTYFISKVLMQENKMFILLRCQVG